MKIQYFALVGIGLPPMRVPLIERHVLFLVLWFPRGGGYSSACHTTRWSILSCSSRKGPSFLNGPPPMSLLFPLSSVPTAVRILPWIEPPVPAFAAAAAAACLWCLFRWTCSSTASLRRLRSPQLRRVQQVRVCVFGGGC